MKIRRVKDFIFALSALLTALLPAYAQERDSLERHYELEKTVLVSRKEAKPLRGLMSGNLTLDTKNLDWLPQILGTPDILKTLQLMPGITASGEMDAGVYVRGADPGQVSVLFDGARVYFPSHLLNFYSVFNSDHIASASVLKSGISPSYGGGVSGVIDVSSPDELASRLGGKLNVGLISSQATLAVPLGRKSSLMLSGRGTYLNFLLKGISLAQGAAQPEYGFYDGNMTWLCKPDENNLIKLNAYYCKDDLLLRMGGYSLDGDMDWKNAAASLKWNRNFANDMEMNHNFSMSIYDNNVRMFRENIRIVLPSGIMDLQYKGDLRIPFSQSSLRAGLDYVYHRTKVQTPMVSGLYGSENQLILRQEYTHEFAAHAEWSKWFSFPLSLDLGLRFSGASTGGTVYTGFEPRLSLSYDCRENMRLRLSAVRQMQYVNMVSVSGMGLPTDFLVPSGPSVRPQASSTASLAFSHAFLDNMYEYSVEPYVSRLDNLLEFDGKMFDLFGADYSFEDHILTGKGMNYGVELMFKKNKGTVNGWISYTFSRSLRSFQGIMDGAVFPSKHDRPHNLSCVLNYNPFPQWTFSAVFVYATGSSYTQPIGLYMVGESLVHEYGQHNAARMPDYNRLDLSATYRFPQKGRCCHSINCSIYNVYARHNSIMRAIRIGYDEAEPTKLAMWLVGVRLYTILPSISYSLSF